MDSGQLTVDNDGIGFAAGLPPALRATPLINVGGKGGFAAGPMWASAPTGAFIGSAYGILHLRGRLITAPTGANLICRAGTSDRSRGPKDEI